MSTLARIAGACGVLAILFGADTGNAGPPDEHPEAPEILHMPLLERHAEQGILRAVPITVELPRDVALRARRVLVHYRLWGDPDWTTLELRREGARYVGAVPCLEISTVTGDLKYYIRVHDVEGRVIATGASRVKPYLVVIKHDAALAPGAPRTAKCPDPADCPRGLPGCASERVVDIACKTDADCEGGMTCSWRGFCERADRRTNWFSLAAEQDLGVVARTGACTIAAQENEGYACIRSDGEQYVGTAALTNEPLGGATGPTRLVGGYDRLVDYDLSLGIRVAWALRGEGPMRGAAPFVPLSIAARITHWFGEDPFAHRGLRPYALLTAGYEQFDLETSIHVREDPTVATRGRQGGNDLEQTLTLWKRAGDGYVGAGTGLSLPFGPMAAYAEVGLAFVMPYGALVFTPTAGVAAGF